MRDAVRSRIRLALVFAGVALACVPLAFVLTFLLVPLWRWIEATYGIESIGHSGPADWCFSLVYFLTVVPGLVLAVRLSRPRSSRGAS